MFDIKKKYKPVGDVKPKSKLSADFLVDAVLTSDE